MTGLWQEHYTIPRTDPRFLASTVDDHVRDMYGVMVRNGVQRRATDKVAEAADRAHEIADDHERIRTAIETGEFGKKVLAFEKSRHAAPPVLMQVVTVRTGTFKSE